MSDLISRQAAIDALAKFVPYAICDESTESYTNGLTDAYNLICQLPSAQPEIIRCKDCKHWLPHTQFGYDYDEYHNYCERHLPDDDFYAFRKEAEDYCSWAEREEE